MRQGYILAPTLFNTCINWVMWEMVGTTDCGISLEESMITNFNFADYIVISVATMEVLVGALDAVSTESEPQD